MADKKNLADLKTQLKEWAFSIKSNKPLFKQAQRDGSDLKSDLEMQLWRLKFEYRHHHIAYCEMRGRTRDQIEKPGEFNKANEDRIAKVKEEYEAKWPEWQTFEVPGVSIANALGVRAA